ncbi:MAG: sulfatase [Planctomycetota bacterium]|nr:sulfatase [Planctomycetota bacterium]
MLRLLTICIVLSLCSATAANAQSTKPSSSGKPLNILWLSVEDMSPWLACYGDKTAPTPNVDRLAREGVRYANAFATTPVCAPARHTIITGMYATSTGAMHMRNGSRSKAAGRNEANAYDGIPLYEAVPPPAVRCFPEYLRAAGWYATNNVKTDYQFTPPPTAWNESSGKAHWRNRKDGQPFFAVFNCTFTHEGQAFPDAQERADVVKPSDVSVPPYYPDTPTVRDTLAQTYNNIVAMDKWVGERLAEVEKDGQLDSTIIVFFSDHGVGLPRGKRSMYHSGLRVPLIVRFPDGKGSGTTDERLVSFIDWAPTTLSLAGIKQPAHMRGVPFLGSLIGEAPKYAFATADRMDATKDTTRAVTDGRYKYVRNFKPEIGHLPPTAYRDNLTMMRDIDALRASGKAMPEQWQIVSTSKPREEFYDTQADRHEVRNVIEAPEHQARIKDMREALDRWMTETNDLGLIQPETKLVKEKLWPPDGVQPTTAAPVATIAPAGEGKATLTIQSDTDGASIGFRRKGERAWSVYADPVPMKVGADYETVAHRIGFKRSRIAMASPAPPATSD